jgi:photosystem II stability/assembly factor-like uncharacterized protein
MSRELRALAVMGTSVLLLAVAVATSLRAQVAVPAAPPPRVQLAFDQGLISAETGWVTEYAVGDRSRSRLWLTTDGGLHWKRSVLAGAPIYSRFFDSQRGAVVTVPGGDGRNSAQIWSTSDGGGHWELALLPEQPTAAYPQAFFSDLDNGWELRVGAKNEQVALYHTANRGGRWQRLRLPKLPLPLSARITYADADHGLIFVRPDYRSLRVESTVDGGQTWIEAQLADPPISGRSSVLPTSSRLFAGGDGVFDVRVASAGFEDPVDFVYTTRDFGRSWSAPIRLPRPDTAEPVTTFVSFADPNVWWLAGGRQVFLTDDGGRSWSSLRPGIPDGLYVAGLSAVSRLAAWLLVSSTPLVGVSSAHPVVLTERPRRYLTLDGGRTWSERTPTS